MSVYCLASNSILFHVAANLKYYRTPVESHRLRNLMKCGNLSSAHQGR